MSGTIEHRGAARSGRWRLLVWGGAALALLAPWVMMRFDDEVAWTGWDFVLFGGMLVAACGLYELAARARGSGAYRAAVAVAIAAAFLLLWINLAVGIIGTEDDPANLMYGGVLAVLVAGALVARFAPAGMARALVATAIAQGLVAVVALVAGLGYTLILTGVFVALWLTSARLFRAAAEASAAARRAA